MAQPTPINVDLRTHRTRKRIQEALIELTVEKGYLPITVQDIVDRARINRSTFYRHYLDKDDLLSKYMDEVTGSTFQDDMNASPDEKPPSGLVKLLKHIQIYSEFYRVMLSANGHPLVSESLRQKIERRFRLLLAEENAPRDSHTPNLDMQLRYISAAGIGAILWWVENNIPCTPRELGVWIAQLSAAGLGVTLKWSEHPVKHT